MVPWFRVGSASGQVYLPFTPCQVTNKLKQCSVTGLLSAFGCLRLDISIGDVYMLDMGTREGKPVGHFRAPSSLHPVIMNSSAYMSLSQASYLGQQG